MDNEVKSQEDKRKRYFKFKKLTNYKDLIDGASIEESDLCIETPNGIVQYEFVSNDDRVKLPVKPGSYNIVSTSQGIRPFIVELKNNNILNDLANTAAISKEASQFFSNLDIYKELQIEARRGVLLWSPPGFGKTVAITKICNELILNDPGTVVFNWNPNTVDSDSFHNFLSLSAEFTPECTKFVLIIEDIGGVSYEDGPRRVDSGILNLIDGNDQCFKLPTLILATTNYPQSLLGALADRPGRFDKILELPKPLKDEQLKLFKFYSKGHFTDAELEETNELKGVRDFGPAHIKEIVVRSRITNTPIKECAMQLIEHRARFNKSFTNQKSLGILND